MANIFFDSKQQEAIKLIASILEKLEEKKSFLLNLFSSREKCCGVYLHGGVGRGKSVIMKQFFTEISLKKKLIHFQQLMHELHKHMHGINDKSTDKVIKNLSEELFSDIEILFLDEFEIKDISDAMLIMRLFDYLVTNNIFIFLNTNSKPSDLYKDGIQRDSFLPFIHMIQEKFFVHHLSSDKDYRMEILSGEDNIFVDKNKNDKLKVLFLSIVGNKEIKPTTVVTFGRDVEFEKTCENKILWTNFEELFARDLSYADYVNLCKIFEVILIDNVDIIKADEGDKALRFINFIDNAYLNNVKIFIHLYRPLYEIYPTGKFAQEFLRTVSRINEMNSSKYSSQV